MDTTEYIWNLEVTDALREPVIRQAAELLAPRDASRGLDLGNVTASRPSLRCAGESPAWRSPTRTGPS